MFFVIALDVLVVAFFLSRQLRVRPVPRVLALRLPIILGVIGLIEFLDYRSDHHITSTDYAWFLGTLIIGAGVLGAVRALTVKIWETNNWVVRQGTWLTIGLWLVSLALHFVIDTGAGHAGVANLETATLLLYFAVTLGVQAYVVHLRAMPHWNSLGPEAGRGIQVSFGQGPGGGGAFFTTFRNGGASWGPNQPTRPAPPHDPSIIDAEVVDDDDAPPELHRPD
jgi:hypothetical protein